MKFYNTIKCGGCISDCFKPLTAENQQYVDEISGSGILNNILKKVPEIHLGLPDGVESEYVPNGSFNDTKKYSFCGPGTKVRERITEGYEGVNTLDEACKRHDIAYSENKSTKDRNFYDDILANEASAIATNQQEPEYVRKDARLVTGVMGAKSRFGMGLKKKTIKN